MAGTCTTLPKDGGENWDDDFRAMRDAQWATVGDEADAIVALRRGEIDNPDPVATGGLSCQR